MWQFSRGHKMEPPVRERRAGSVESSYCAVVLVELLLGVAALVVLAALTMLCCSLLAPGAVGAAGRCPCWRWAAELVLVVVFVLVLVR